MLNYRKGLKVHIRWMIRRDMSEVLDIEKESLEFPWVEEDFIRCLRQRNCIGMVAERNTNILGYMVYELFHNRIRLMRLAVQVGSSRQGIGTQMMDKLKAKLPNSRRSKITVPVWERNLDAQLFLRAMGFRAVKTLRGRYSNGDAQYFMVFQKPKSIEDFGGGIEDTPRELRGDYR